MKWAVAIYTEYTGKNEIKIVEADSDANAIQMAVEGLVEDIEVNVNHLIGYYWESKNISVSKPVKLV